MSSVRAERGLVALGEPSRLFGRERELALIGDLLEHVDAGGGSLLVHGEPGIGKSALLVEARRQAERLGMPVLSTAGAPFERQMPFAGLHRLLRPLLHQATSLPEPQRAALSVAFGVSDGPPPDTFLIALAALELLAERAGEAGLLLLVEDVHWLDTATCDVLTFVARRVEMEPIIVLFAARDGAASHVQEAGLPDLWLGPLDEASASTLLAAHAPQLAPDLRQRLLAEAGGNPLALVEFPRAFGSEQFTAFPAKAPLPITERLERAFAGRFSELPPATRLLLVVASLDEAADLGEIVAAASLVADRPATVDDVAPAEAAGLVSVNGHSLRFRHPLVRAAIHGAAAGSVRQAAHKALAQVQAADPERSVWHQAAALTGPDGQVAADLEAAAGRALRRGAPALAAAALERAAQLSERPSTRGRLLVRAAEIEFELGRTDLALRHLAGAKPLELGHEERIRLTLWLEAFNEDSWSGAARVAAFAEIANRMTDADGPALALRSLMTVAVGCWWGNPTQETRDIVVDASERLQVAPDDPTLIAILACADPVKRGAVAIDRIARMTPDPSSDPATLHLLGWAATAVWAFDLSWPFLTSAVDGLREQGRLGLLAQALVSQSWAAIHLAKGMQAMSAADEAGRLARETGQLRWALAADLAKATAVGERGDFETARALADQAEGQLLPIGAQAMLSLVQFARGRYAVAHQHYSEGLEELRRVVDPSDVAYHPFVGAWALPDLVDAAAHTGRPDEASRYLRELESLAAQTQAPYLRATVAYARPLLAPDDRAEALYQTALEGDLSSWPCYRGRLLLNYGRWLRRHEGLPSRVLPCGQRGGTSKPSPSTDWPRSRARSCGPRARPAAGARLTLVIG